MTTTKARELAELRAVYEKQKDRALATVDGILEAELRVNVLDSARRAGDLAACDAGAAAMRALARAQKRAYEAAHRRDVAAAELEAAEVAG